MSLLQQHRPSESYLRTLPLGTHPKDHESRLPALSMAPDRAVRSSLPLAEISGEVTFTLSEGQKQQLVLGLSVRKSRASQANSLASITSRRPCDAHHRLRHPSLSGARSFLNGWIEPCCAPLSSSCRSHSATPVLPRPDRSYMARIFPTASNSAHLIMGR